MYFHERVLHLEITISFIFICVNLTHQIVPRMATAIVKLKEHLFVIMMNVEVRTFAYIHCSFFDSIMPHTHIYLYSIIKSSLCFEFIYKTISCSYINHIPCPFKISRIFIT